MAMSGLFATGHDVGGFSGPVPEAELLIRWTQAGVLHPRFLMNSWKSDGIYTSPWLHPEATPAVREAIRLRYRLMPYLYSLMHRGLGGEAPLRPTFVDFPDDAKCFEDCDDLMFGPSLLAAPVIAPGARARRVYLPKGPGEWFDFWGEERFEAGSEVVVAAPLDRLPLLAPAGAIVPMTDSDDDYARRHDEPSRKVLLFPGTVAGASRFTLFEDDGLSAAGATTKVKLELVWSKARIALSARVEGGYELPYKSLRVVLRQGEKRRLQLTSFAGAPTLTAE
jgi:alpha-glucosidase